MEQKELKWQCPNCGANETGCKNTKEPCKGMGCDGLICECDAAENAEPSHGISFENPCKVANCYHCEWGGTLPVKPKGLLAWEKKALEAGWQMPHSRKDELEQQLHTKKKK